ncbi:MAG: radical SAM protein [Candidatus Omnitrophota bacterium]
MKILLTNPPWKTIDNRYGVRAGSRWPFTVKARNEKRLDYIPFPFFIAYAAAVLEKEGLFNVKVLDSIAEGLNESEYYKRVLAFNPDIIFAETSAPSCHIDINHVKKTKEILGRKSFYILGGPHATVFANEILNENPEVDFCTVGEYELTLKELILKISKNDCDMSNVKGVAWRKDGHIVINERTSAIDLDSLPFPAWHHFPMYRYKDYFSNFEKPMVNVMASRGCPYQCNFCLWPDVMYGSHTYRIRDVVRVVDEIEHLIQQYRFRTIYFDDDSFNIGKNRLLALCSEIKKRNLKFQWVVMARADTTDEETLNEMASCGLYAIKYGIESGSQHLIDICGKSLELAKAIKTVEFTKKLGIKTHLTFTIGLKGETKETMQQTLDLALKLSPDSCQFSICTPFPGTKYYAETKENNLLLTEDFSKFDGSSESVIRTASLNAKEISRFLNKMNRAWSSLQFKRKIKRKFLLKK